MHNGHSNWQWYIRVLILWPKISSTNHKGDREKDIIGVEGVNLDQDVDLLVGLMQKSLNRERLC